MMGSVEIAKILKRQVNFGNNDWGSVLSVSLHLPIWRFSLFTASLGYFSQGTLRITHTFSMILMYA